jgi:hypothetical protein
MDVLRQLFYPRGAPDAEADRLSEAVAGEAVVAHLNGLVATKVTVTLDIQAEIPDGAPDDVARTVTENALRLHLSRATGFEAD